MENFCEVAPTYPLPPPVLYTSPSYHHPHQATDDSYMSTTHSYPHPSPQPVNPMWTTWPSPQPNNNSNSIPNQIYPASANTTPNRNHSDLAMAYLDAQATSHVSRQLFPSTDMLQAIADNQEEMDAELAPPDYLQAALEALPPEEAAQPPVDAPHALPPVEALWTRIVPRTIVDNLR